MKIGHISDLHYCPEHFDEVDRCVRFAVGDMLNEGCECAVISGDLFDHRIDLHDPCVYALMNRVADLAEHMPVLILQGTFSHDTPGSLNVFKAMNGNYPIHVADSIGQVMLINSCGKDTFEWMPCIDSYAFDEIPGRFRCRALFSCLPPVNKANLTALNPDGDVAKAAGEYVYDLMRGWSVINEKASAAGIPTVVVSHGTINGSMTEQGVPMHGNDHEFTTGSLFSSKAHAIMLGHIHQNQYWANKETKQAIAYPGSPGRLHFGELTDKGFLIWDVDADAANAKFIKTPAKKLIQIDFDGTPDVEKLAAIAEGAEDAHVRIRYAVDEEHKDSINKAEIEAMFGAAGKVKIEPRIKPVTRIRAEGITRSHSLNEKIETWCAVTGYEDQQLAMQGALSMLQAGDPDAIINNTIEKIEGGV